MKGMPSLTMAQGWVKRFHQDYSIMQGRDGLFYAVAPDSIDRCARQGFTTIESPQQSGAYQTGDYQPYDGNGWQED